MTMAHDQEITDKKPLYVEMLAWDSDFFGFPVAQIIPERLHEQDMSDVMNFCHQNNVRLLQFKCDAHDRGSILLAESHDFHFADVRMILSNNIANFNNDQVLPDGITFRLADEGDIDALMSIAENLYLNSRYYFDTNFPREQVHDFYKDWVRKAVLGQFDDLAYILVEGETPVAFCTAQLGADEAFIGLVGVHPGFIGRGYGSIMLSATLSAFKTRGVSNVSVTTQGRNYPAQRLYQKANFKIQKMHIYYHCWLAQ